MSMNPEVPLREAIKLVGLTSLSKAVGVKPPSIHNWLKTGRAPSHRVLAIEAATGGRVTRFQLRPDVFGPDPAKAQQTKERAA